MFSAALNVMLAMARCTHPKPVDSDCPGNDGPSSLCMQYPSLTSHAPAASRPFADVNKSIQARPWATEQGRHTFTSISCSRRPFSSNVNEGIM
jgi:hypothetical protein